jgi:uncharacterized protein
MAGTSLLALIDDIATLLDDVAVMTKVAAKKTAGVLGDDLALNAQQVAGVNADRELPVVWAVAKGSLLNKVILVPAALLISAVAGWLITPLLMIGGAFLCYEGFEKLAHKFLHSQEEDKADHDALLQAIHDPATDMLAFEQTKIKGAIRTDFILSAEIIVIALGAIQDAAFGKQVAALVAIALVMTVGVYALVAAIVKLDDLGFYMVKDGAGRIQRCVGRGILRAAPVLMKTLSVVGTAAMFMVGGSILAHGVPAIHESLHPIMHGAEAVPIIGGVMAALLPTLVDAIIGIIAGGVVLAVVSVVGRLCKRG